MDDPIKASVKHHLDEVEDEPAPKLPWDQFTEWLHCICIVTFDLELGQALECIYPKHTALSETERTNICYLSFPDSNSGCMGDTEYCFRIRRNKRGPSYASKTDYLSTKDCPTTLLKDETHFYGYVYFRQVRDKTLRRGYFQKSLVLLSSLPYYNFFKDIADIIAPEYFDNGEPCLEAACHDIDRWPSPVPGRTLNLPLMGMVLHIRIPTTQDKPGTTILDSTENSNVPLTLASINEVDLAVSLCDVLPHIHLLWELVLVGEPIVVMAPSPTACAATVLALVSSIHPLRYYCDYRPYFTIHDSEFKEYTTRTQAPPPVILGVTNPFFAKTLQHWPHIVRVNENTTVPSIRIAADAKLKKTSDLKTVDPKIGVYTKYKQFLKNDKAFLKTLAKEGTRKDRSASLRRHFLELTQSFIIPLERYLASLMPLQKCISPLKAPPGLKPFRPEELIETVESAGPKLTSGTKGDWRGLYRRFLHSVNFQCWWQRRRSEMEAKLASLHFVKLSEVDLLAWSRDKSEVEIVDIVLRVRQSLDQVQRLRAFDVPADCVERLKTKVAQLIDVLPQDLRAILVKN